MNSNDHFDLLRLSFEQERVQREQKAPKPPSIKITAGHGIQAVSRKGRIALNVTQQP